MTSAFRLSAFLSLICLAASVPAADQSIVTEYGYDAEGHITSTTKTLLTAPPVVQQVRPTFVRKGGERELTIIGSNLYGASVTVDVAGVHVVSASPSNSPVVVLSVPESVANGIHSLTVTTALGSASASLEVRSPLPSLHASPLPLEVAAGSSIKFKLSLSSAADTVTMLSVAVEPAGGVTLSHDPLSVAVGQSVFPEVTVTGVTAGQSTLRFSSDEFSGFALSVQVTDSQLPDSAEGESYQVQAPLLGVMNGEEPVVATAPGEFAVVVGLELTVLNGPAPGHLSSGQQTATLPSAEVGVVNGPTPEYLRR